MEKKKVGYLVDSQVVADLEVKLDQIGMSGARFVEACMRAYVQGKFKMLEGECHFEGSVSRETIPTPPPQKTDTPKRAPGRPKISQERQEWHDMDHSNRLLKDFDYPDESHIHGEVDPRSILDVNEFGEITKKTYLSHMYDEFEAWRVKYDDRMWNIEFWNFARCVAKKFFTLNKITNLRYDEMKMQSQLFELKDNLEDAYQYDIKAQAYYDKHKTLEGFNVNKPI